MGWHTHKVKPRPMGTRTLATTRTRVRRRLDDTDDGGSLM